MTRTSVGILRGGTSSEYNLSLKTGAAMLAALPESEFDTRDIFVDKRGYWHQRGIPVDAARALSQVDVVLNALHGGVGEDGTVQRLLLRAGVPFAGSTALPSASSLNKIRARQILRAADIPMPRGISFSGNLGFNTGDMAREVFSRFGPPYVVKPPSEGAAVGILIAPTIIELPNALADVITSYGSALVEEQLSGEEANVGIIEHFRDQELYALPPAHVILPTGATFMKPEHHEEGSLQHRVPSTFSHSIKQTLMDLARKAHRALGLAHFSDADFIVTKRGPYLLEMNSLPYLYEGSAFPKMLDSVGSSIKEFVRHAIHLARR